MLRRLVVLLLLASLPLLAKDQCAFCRHDGSQFTLAKQDYASGALLVCQKCVQKLPPCAVCDLPSNNKQYRDGRELCASCLKLNLADQKQAEKLYNKVVAFVHGFLSEKVSPVPPVRFCDDDELQTRLIEGGGRSIKVIGFYVAYNPEQIYIRSYEQLPEAGATLAHEFTHAWQSRHAVSQDRALKEGFACWVEYHYLLSIGETSRAYGLTTVRDPDYGDSLRKLLEIEKRQGKAAVIKLGRQGAKLPG